MDFFILSPIPDLQVVGVLEGYESLVWTERYFEAGDFELRMPNTLENRLSFPKNTCIMNSKTGRVMQVENIERTKDQEDGDWLTYTGRGIETLFEIRPCFKRIVQQQGAGGSGAEIMRLFVRSASHFQQIDPKDLLHFIILQSDPPETPFLIYNASQFENTYEALVNISKMSGVGFRLLAPYTERNKSSFTMFEPYVGVDRSTAQRTTPWVIFRPDLDVILNTHTLESDKDYRNVAIVRSGSRLPVSENLNDNEYEVVTIGDGATATQLNRKVLLVDASSITTRTTQLIPVGTGNNQTYKYADNDFYSRLRAEGQRALLKQTKVNILEGELDYKNQYVFGEDYFLGDIVQMVDDTGKDTRLRVSEYIFTHDGTGISNYPTFENVN